MVTATAFDKDVYDAFTELLHRAAMALPAVDAMPGEHFRYCAADLTEMHDDQSVYLTDSTWDEWVRHLGGIANIPAYAKCLAAGVARGRRDADGFEVKA